MNYTMHLEDRVIQGLSTRLYHIRELSTGLYQTGEATCYLLLGHKRTPGPDPSCFNAMHEVYTAVNGTRSASDHATSLPSECSIGGRPPEGSHMMVADIRGIVEAYFLNHFSGLVRILNPRVTGYHPGPPPRPKDCFTLTANGHSLEARGDDCLMYEERGRLQLVVGSHDGKCTELGISDLVHIAWGAIWRKPVHIRGEIKIGGFPPVGTHPVVLDLGKAFSLMVSGDTSLVKILPHPVAGVQDTIDEGKISGPDTLQEWHL